MPVRVLLVEDDDMIASPLVRTLEREGYAVHRVGAGAAALEWIGATGAELVLLDLGLPDMDGLEVCRRLREDGFVGAIMILTARGGELDQVVGLDVGADDYLAKPFGLSELLARTRAVLRRTTAGALAAEPLPAADPTPPQGEGTPPARARETTADHPLRIDTLTRRVWVDGEELAVTAKEFDVLALLDEQPGAVVTREHLMDEVWDENWFGSTKTLDATIGRLRTKLEERAVPARVVTVRGIGFRLERDPPDA
jgi:DNA-binding response OmpR family regulator